MRLLCVSHTATIAGAEHSLLVLLGALPDGVTAALACPEGELAHTARALGVDVRPIAGTDLSGRLHLRHTPREALRLMRSARQVAAIARDFEAGVIHANTPRAGLISLAAGRRVRVAVHVRDSLPPGRVPGLTLSVLAGFWLARAAIRLFGTTAETLTPGGRIGFLFRTVMIPALVAGPILIPFRLPRNSIELVIFPTMLMLFGALWILIGAGFNPTAARPARPSPSLTVPLIALIAVLLVFQLVLRPGIQFS